MPARAPDRSALEDLGDLVAAMDPDELQVFAAQLPAPDRRLLEYVLGERHAIGWRADPAALAIHLGDPDLRKRWRYVALLSTAFARAVTGESPRQIWNLPSRMGKTTLLRWGVVWGLDRRPESRWIMVSYADDLAVESASTVRDLCRAHAADLRVSLRRDRQRADRFVSDAGGGVLGAGMNTAIIGWGAGDGGGLLIDDPMKSWQEAHSEAARRRVWDNYTGVLRHRLDQEEAPIVVVHARWHEDDLSGRLIAGSEDTTGEAFEVIDLAAIAEEGRPDPLGRAPGEVLEPERFPPDAVRARHHALGSSYLVAALEQQRPAKPEGTELLREWFVLAETGELPHAPEIAVAAWDLKLKNREAGDYVVGQCWWRVAGGYWLMDQIRGRFDHATTENAIALLLVRHPEIRTSYIEAAGSADEVVPELRKAQDGYTVADAMALRLGMSPEEREQVQLLRRRGCSRLETVPPVGDKTVRARAHIAPKAEPGLVKLPAGAAWVPAYLDEIAAFPDGLHDDQVDASSLALSKLSQGEATAAAPSRAPITPAAPGGVRKAAPGAPRRGASVRAAGGLLPRRLPGR